MPLPALGPVSQAKYTEISSVWWLLMVLVLLVVVLVIIPADVGHLAPRSFSDP